MEPAVIASILVSLIAALAGYASQRSAAKASTRNVATSSRTELEKEAYERARAFDTETIKRQDAELAELRENQKHLNEDIKLVNAENYKLHDENKLILEDNNALRAEVRALRLRVTRIQRGIPENSTEPIREREIDTNPMIMREIFDAGEGERD